MPTSLRIPRGASPAPTTPLLVLLFLAWPSGAGAQHIAPVTVVGLDYAYQVPTTLPAGLTAFAFENHGKVRHEIAVLRLKTGVAPDSLMHVIDSVAARRALTEGVGVLFAEPGQASLGRLLVELVAGRTYVLFCNFQDMPDKPRHMMMGMIAIVNIK